MEIHSAIKKHEIMRFAGKCVKLGKIILSKVTCAQEEKCFVFSLIHSS